MRNMYLSTKDVATLLKVSEGTVKRLSNNGFLNCVKSPGGHRRFTIYDVVNYVEKNNLQVDDILMMRF